MGKVFCFAGESGRLWCMGGLPYTDMFGQIYSRFVHLYAVVHQCKTFQGSFRDGNVIAIGGASTYLVCISCHREEKFCTRITAVICRLPFKVPWVQVFKHYKSNRKTRKSSYPCVMTSKAVTGATFASRVRLLLEGMLYPRLPF